MSIVNEVLAIQEKIEKKYKNIFKSEYVDEAFLDENYYDVINDLATHIDLEYLLELYNKIQQEDVYSMIRFGDVLLENVPFDILKTKEAIDLKESTLVSLGFDWDYCCMNDEVRNSIEQEMNRVQLDIKELKSNETFMLRFKYLRMAFFYFRIASEYNDPEALWRLGWRYILSDYCFRYLSCHYKGDKAVICWKNAAAAGHQLSINKLREMNIMKTLKY